jgi:hypothetical protein
MYAAVYSTNSGANDFHDTMYKDYFYLEIQYLIENMGITVETLILY